MLGEVPTFSLPSSLPNLPMVADISWNGEFDLPLCAVSNESVPLFILLQFRLLFMNGKLESHTLVNSWSIQWVSDTLLCVQGLHDNLTQDRSPHPWDITEVFLLVIVQLRVPQPRAIQDR